MAFNINSTEIIDNASTINFNFIVNEPSVMATAASLHANTGVYNTTVSLSGSVLTI